MAARKKGPDRVTFKVSLPVVGAQICTMGSDFILLDNMGYRIVPKGTGIPMPVFGAPKIEVKK